MWSYRFRILWQRFGPPKATADRNAWYLCVEIVFASILSAAAAFNSAYVVRLGASNTVIGLMSSIPALEAMLLYIPMAIFLERRKRYMPWMVGSLFASRIVYLIVALLPLLITTDTTLGNATAIVLIAATIPSVLFSVAWNPMFADVVPARTRASVMTTRSILSAATVAPAIFLAGRYLDANQASFPRNYQWLFLVGFIGGVISVYLVALIRTPPQESAHATSGARPTLRDMLGFSVLRESPEFLRIMINSFFVSIGSWLVGPLYIILYVRELGASDGWIGASSTLGNIGAIVGYWLARKVVKRIGENRALKLSAPTTFSWPFLVALVPNLTVILIGGLIQNVLTPTWSLSHSVIWMSRLPDKSKMTATAVYSTAMNVGAFVMPLLGVALANAIGIRTTLLIGGALNLAGSLMFYLFPVTSKPEAPQGEAQAA